MNLNVKWAVWWGFVALWCGAMAVFGMATDRPTWAKLANLVLFGVCAYRSADFAGKAAAQSDRRSA